MNKFNKESSLDCLKYTKLIWSNEDDDLLLKLLDEHGHSSWKRVSERFSVYRTPKQCRERYCYYLKPGLKKGNWTEQEDQAILEMHKLCGKQWSKIALILPGRTDVAVKSRFYSISKEAQVVLPSLQFANIPNGDSINCKDTEETEGYSADRSDRFSVKKIEWKRKNREEPENGFCAVNQDLSSKKMNTYSHWDDDISVLSDTINHSREYTSPRNVLKPNSFFVPVITEFPYPQPLDTNQSSMFSDRNTTQSLLVTEQQSIDTFATESLSLNPRQNIASNVSADITPRNEALIIAKQDVTTRNLFIDTSLAVDNHIVDVSKLLPVFGHPYLFYDPAHPTVKKLLSVTE